MRVILLTNHYNETPLSIVKDLVLDGFKLVSLEKSCKKEIMSKAKEADYFLVSGRLPIDKEVIEAAPKLKMVQRTGVGMDMLDMKVLNEKKIPVYINKGVNARSVAEHAMMLILTTLRRLTVVDKNVKNGVWLKQDMGVQSRELGGKTIGILGMGSIGQNLVEMLKGFNVNIIYNDMYRLSESKEKDLGIEYAPMLEVFRRADIISLHCPLTSKTENIINKKSIAFMKEGVIIINTARGGLIDEFALVNELKSGHIKAAGLDVLKKEPPMKTNPLFELDNVVVTPHVGGLTYEAFKSMMVQAMNNIKMFEEGNFEDIEDKRVFKVKG